MLASAAAANTDTTVGAAYVTTLPSGAEIWFDGTYVGHSPVLVDGLVPGRHKVTITKTGWAAQEAGITVEGGTVVMSSSRLMAGTRSPGGENGTLVLRAAPAGVSLALDGASLQAPPSQGISVPPGSHRLEVTQPHRHSTRPFTIYPDTTTTVILREKRELDHRSAVVAPAEDYLPTDAFAIDGARIVVRYLGHIVVAHFGDPKIRLDGTTTAFDSAPVSIGGKLYLPLELLEKLSGDVSNGH